MWFLGRWETYTKYMHICIWKMSKIHNPRHIGMYIKPNWQNCSHSLSLCSWKKKCWKEISYNMDFLRVSHLVHCFYTYLLVDRRRRRRSNIQLLEVICVRSTFEIWTLCMVVTFVWYHFCMSMPATLQFSQTIRYSIVSVTRSC